MPYLIKEFGTGKYPGYNLHLATDEGDELTPGSLWNWIWRAKRKGIEISVYRLVEDISKAEPFDDILIIGPDGLPVLESVRNIRSITELTADPSLACCRIECVLDLS